jgi:hypothetical protein
VWIVPESRANRKLRFHADCDDAVPKSASRRSLLISSKPVYRYHRDAADLTTVLSVLLLLALRRRFDEGRAVLIIHAKFRRIVRQTEVIGGRLPRR